MEFRVEYHPAAERDLEAAIEYYAERVHRLGTAFHDEIRRIERLAIQHPQAGSHLGRDVRRLLLDRFPYAMIYAVERDRLYVLAIAHVRRRPDFWSDRR
jgi:plasmid stabilization system protein ParE